MRYFLVAITLLVSLSQLKGQDSLQYRVDWGTYDLKDLYIGFNSSPKFDSLDATFTSIEFGYAKSSLSKYIHAASGTLYFGQELGLYRNRLIHGSKAGAWVSANMITLGLELAHQTDYESHSVNLWPSMGLGLYPLKLSMSARVRFTGKGFQPQNKLSFNISYMLFKLSREKRTIKKKD